MHVEDLKYLLALTLIDDIGPVTVNGLVDAFGSASEAMSASPSGLAAVRGVSAAIAGRITTFRDWVRVDDELERAAKLGITLVTAGEDSYPPLLRHIYDYPPLLYVRGELKPDDICVALVGSRRATAQGRYTCERISRELVLRGITVVSGMARGIDSSAHRGALAARGRTLAVMGSGLDVIYPPENRDLYEKIAEQGAVVSEYPFGSEPLAHHFPRRNRIISGMSYGVVVIEATEKSGSLITANLALEQGRCVFALPGGIETQTSRGTNTLIRNGATLVQDVEDILCEIEPQVDVERPSEAPSGPDYDTTESTAANGKTGKSADEEPGDVERELLRLIGDRPVHLDDLIARCDVDINRILGMLLSLELKGMVRQMPGKYFVIKE
ncbi:MAG TPA: DNA-protecting protein DprA [Deltaproteobacteria bacterium]|nr:DNA-protecting protein DprA [Deltaproteobacteria bacterium]